MRLARLPMLQVWSCGGIEALGRSQVLKLSELVENKVRFFYLSVLLIL